MVNQELLNDTLQKIYASLNKRFEKDADLYISRQDENDIRKHLCAGAYGAVADMAKAKGLSHDIVVKVLLRSAGVLNVTDFSRFRRELHPVLRDVNYSVLKDMMEDVFRNSVYMQKKVRHILFHYYMSSLTTEQRLEYWNGGLVFDAKERMRLYQLILEKAGGPLGTLQEKIGFMNQAFTRFPSIMQDRNAILKLKDTLDEGEREQFFQYLSGEIRQPTIGGEVYAFALVNAYCSYGEKAFQDAVSQLRTDRPAQFKEYVKALRKLFEKEQDPETLVRMFDLLYRALESPHMKNHVRRRVEEKLLPLLKTKTELYQRRKDQVDKLLSGLETTEQKPYESLDDVAADIAAGAFPAQVAYKWLNLSGERFTESVGASFAELAKLDGKVVKSVYSWMFQHSMRKGGTTELEKLCDRLAVPLGRFAGAGLSSELYEAMDALWLSHVLEYKLRSKNSQNLEEYMFAAHFSDVKQWQQ